MDGCALFWSDLDNLLGQLIGQSFQKIELLRRDAEDLSKRRWVLGKQLGELRVLGSQLLDDRLNQSRVLLHQLAKVLDLRLILDGCNVDVTTRSDGNGQLLRLSRLTLCGRGLLGLLLLGQL